MNDAKGCYDRVQHVAAILVLMSYGLAYIPATLIFQTLQEAEHRIKTGYGVSDVMYGSDTVPQIMGTGQGNGCAPTAWCLISSKMIQMMKNHSYGVQLRSALSKTLFNIVCFAFVDDTDLPMTAPTVDTLGEELQETFQETLD